ncbi:MAG: rhodanese-like domain-containing protein [Myxococcota bacterium]|nr:rhodanese-like domain-containing protein [Myxococcota bacterium]
MAGWLALACEPAGADRPMMSQGELVERLGAGGPPVLVDVRTPGEYDSGHIPGALNLPLQDLESRLSELDPGAELVVYCERGGRAQRAMLILEEAGYGSARQLEGDMSAWREGGLPCQGC